MTDSIRLSEKRFRSALDGLLEGVQILDRDLRYVYVNKAAAAQGRHTVEGVIGRLMTEVFPGVEHSEFYRAVQGALAQGPPRRLDTPFAFEDGSVGYFQLIIEPVEDGVFILSIETTAQRNAEAALAGSELRHRSMLQGLPDLVFLLERDGTIVDLHAPPDVPLLRSREELIGASVVDTLPPALGIQTRDAIRRVASSGMPETLSYDLLFPDGTHRFEATIVTNEDGRITIASRDVTTRHALEEQLRQAQKMEAVGQLTGGIAHDFNNVLTVITANAGLVMNELPADSPLREEIGDIIAAAHRGADMISQLLQFSRRSVVRREEVDPSTVLLRVANMLRRLLPESVRVEMGELHTGAFVSLDTGALEQVVTNLCTNARDAMPKGGLIHVESRLVTADARLRESYPWIGAGKFYRIAVRDTGVGMDESTKRRLFEPFFTTKPLGVGTGLGMAMVYGLMKAHAGFVHVESTLGVGTEVSLYFPMSAQAPSAPTRRTPETPREVLGGTEGILLVEDDDAIRSATRRVLELHGYTVFEAADGALGVQAFREHRQAIALMISDLVMPNMGGMAMAEAIRAEGARIPVLFTSGYSTEWLQSESGMDADVRYLQKPWTLADLLAAVRDALATPRDSA